MKKSKTTLMPVSKYRKLAPSVKGLNSKQPNLSTSKRTSQPIRKDSLENKSRDRVRSVTAVTQGAALGRSSNSSNARRLTEAGAYELAIAVAQWFYYEKDAPIMSDKDYDQLERRYKAYTKKSKSPGGIMPGILNAPGNSDALPQLLLMWRN